MKDEESQETGNVGRNSGETGVRRRERGEGRGMRAEVRKNSGNGGKRGQMKKKKKRNARRGRSKRFGSL